MKPYKVTLTELTKKDLEIAKNFYEKQSYKLGDYFLDSIISDLESLQFYGTIHNKKFAYYRMLAKRFPFSIYYTQENENLIVHAILDSRQNPSKIYQRLK